MQSELVVNICRVGIFVICAQVIVHFRPSKSYEKYLKMLVSAMILVQLLRPLGCVINGGNAENLEDRIRWIEERLEENRAKAENSAARGEAIRERMTLEEVRKRMEEEGQKTNLAEETEEPILIEEVLPVETICIE